MTTTTLWGVGRYDGPDGPVTWEIGHEEIQRDLGAAMRRLGEVGVGRGDRILFCSMLSEAGQFWPWILGAMLNGTQLSCADAMASEARRVATYCRLLDLDAVMGVSGPILDGLDELGLPYDEVFGGIRLVLARPDAADRLAAAGVDVTPMALLGPAVVIDGRWDPDEWDVQEESGALFVTSLQARATGFVHEPVAGRGRIVGPGELRVEGEP